MENKRKKIVEDALITGKSIDELIKIKMQEEIKGMFEKSIQKAVSKRFFDIKDVPKGKLFSKDTIFKKFNKNNSTISYINGIQAESMLGLDDITREKLVNGEIDTFSTENAFIKFEYVEIKFRT